MRQTKGDAMSAMIRTDWRLVLLLCAGLVILAGCSEEDPIADPATHDDSDWTLIRSDLARDLEPVVDPVDTETLVGGNHEFALSLLHELGAEGNLLISPLSIRTAFAMVYGGARGQTATEIELALAFGLPAARLHPAWNSLQLALDGRNDPGDEDNPPVELYLTNAVWGRIGYPFVPDYLDLLAVNYGAGVHEIDFLGAPENSRLVINEWVAEKTRRKVLDLLPEQSITSDTAVVLTNALYFCAPWFQPFDADSTATEDFQLLDGGKVSVQMMHKTDGFAYYEDDDCQALEIPFRGRELSMVLILPAGDGYADFVSALDAPALDGILDGLLWQGVSLGMPRFSFEYECQLKAVLMKLGMNLPFTPAADFGGMTQNSLLWISEAYHKTFIKVDEKGTEAAAATAITMVDTGIPDGETAFVANRPFLLLIRDRATDTILFLGCVLEPAE